MDSEITKCPEITEKSTLKSSLKYVTEKKIEKFDVSVQNNKVQIQHSQDESYSEEIIFSEKDTDNNGKWDQREIMKISQENLPTVSISVHSQFTLSVMQKMDTNGDECVDGPEFHENYPYFKKLLETYCLLYRNSINLKVPWVVATLSLFQIIFYVFRGHFEDYLKFEPCKSLEIWRFWTYQFTHSDLCHLTMNVFFQLLLALPLESCHCRCWWRILVIYSAGVVAGAGGYACLLEEKYPLVGASAGVYAMFFANIAFFFLNFETQKKQFITVAVGSTLAYGTLGIVFAESNASHEAHIFGAITGILLGSLLCKNEEETKFEKYWIKTSILLCVILIFTGITKLVLKLDYCKN